ncbi:GntR family transcriptional regulator [Devosia pacifica]|uniref:GntR family transcriptional regulator n=2 Tax=Devosia pacifica TaxID=1335967 RepID=A0A918VSB8_9HYPH|nr:GntR family transcriptional regulator [Devosia pacifica]GHA18564.1 GntR family transcriptional regulator [Devosia pacifica]
MDTTGNEQEQPPSVYELLREDIVSGALEPNARLKVADLSKFYGTSTNPVREALQQLRGEGFVVMEANRGARVRPIDEDFVRDIIEIEVLLEPALTRWFVGVATHVDIEALEAMQERIEELDFADARQHARLDTAFHQLIYDRHYNRHAAELWWKHREILRAISRRYPTSLSRRQAVLSEHRQLIEAIRNQDAEEAAAIVARHVQGSGHHIIEQMGMANRDGARRRAS